MKKFQKVFSIVFIMFLTLGLGACSSSNDTTKKEEGERTVVLAPPILSMLYASNYDTSNIVGANEMVFSLANKEVLELVDKDYKNIDTSFVGDDFNINSEALLSLKPEMIFYYGAMMTKGFNNKDIPMVDTQLQDFDSESLTKKWEALLSDSLKIENKKVMEKEWKTTHDKVDGMKDKMSKPKKGLYIFANMNGTIKVSGAGSYGDNFLKSANITNVASDIKMEQVVNMEQINKWNPDVVYIFRGASANALLNDKIENQDWSYTNAFKNKAIYDIPSAIYSWGAPCSDSPLMPLWLISTSDENAYSPSEFKKDLHAYYKRVYDVDLSDDLLKTITSNIVNEK